MVLSKTWIRQFAEEVPWIERVEEGKPVQCESYRWSHMPRNAYGTPEMENWRCRLHSRWRYDRVSGQSMRLCIAHTWSVFVSMDEQERYLKWKQENGATR